MQHANIEQLSALERRINLSVEMQAIESEVAKRLKHIARTARVDGFRHGKVPMSIVAKQYGDEVRQEVLGNAVERAFSNAVQENKLKVAGFPRIEPKTDAADQSLFEFYAVFEVYPEITLGDISTAEISRPVVTVGDTEIDKTLDVLRKQRVQYESADRAAQTNDLVTLDYIGKVDGEVFAGGEAKGFRVVIGEGRTLPDFETALLDVKAGDKKTFDVAFPADYQAAELAGKTAQFSVEITDVAAPKLPEVDAEFAKSLGVADGDVVKMRAEIKANLEREVKNRVQAQVKDQVMQALLAATSVDTPKSLVQNEAQRLMEQARNDLQARGMNVADIPMPTDLFEERAQRRVALGLILSEVVQTNALAAKPEQIREMIEEIAQSYEEPKDVVSWYRKNPEKMQEIESLALENNVVEWVLGQAKVTDQVLAFDELMGKA
ncbi:trigger factor [Sulfuriferula sp. AH1]|uniref:trigger factor n=1 Tax=Sulfuriferula sp. AH1 TaxID=1985873 RepID=UPI000B3B3F37|nr:trigger factor [Sulfuriferula sp. AH1]ARU31652.1 trigger factor [Sulfuriferula sp. AH1]